MGDIRNIDRDGNVIAVLEAILGRKIDIQDSSSSSAEDYDHLPDVEEGSTSVSDKDPRSDPAPKDLTIGAANPYALVEALLGRQLDRHSLAASEIFQNVLQTDYDELFDLKHRSVLFAGMKLNEKEKRAEMFQKHETKILSEEDLITPDLSRVSRLDDLEKLGLKDLNNIRVKAARMQNGKLRLVLQAGEMGKTVTNREFTKSINDLITPFRSVSDHWTPPNAEWRNMYDYFLQQLNQRVITDIGHFRIGEHRETMQRFDDPIQGCTSNSWFVAALFSVFWANPCDINRATRVNNQNGQMYGHRKERVLAIRFHDKGGRQNNKTETVYVNYEIPINNSNNEPLYCRASDNADIWPALYEKAFAKWITGTKSEQPDITQTNGGDPIKAMAQINGRNPHYYDCNRHAARDLVGLVRSNCVNNKTINPMAAFTHATGSHYTGANVVANHAYSVLGYCVLGETQYVVLRNPWGVTEPQGLTSYYGLLSRLAPEVWHPITLLDQGGVFALEAESFKHVFAYIGVAK